MSCAASGKGSEYSGTYVKLCGREARGDSGTYVPYRLNEHYVPDFSVYRRLKVIHDPCLLSDTTQQAALACLSSSRVNATYVHRYVRKQEM
jgi:hypothetical protein